MTFFYQICAKTHFFIKKIKFNLRICQKTGLMSDFCTIFEYLFHDVVMYFGPCSMFVTHFIDAYRWLLLMILDLLTYINGSSEFRIEIELIEEFFLVHSKKDAQDRSCYITSWSPHICRTILTSRHQDIMDMA